MSIRDGERKVLGAAVLASVLLHLTLVAALPGWRETRRPSPAAPLLARLAPLAQPEARAAVAPEVPRVPLQDVANTPRSSATKRSAAVREEPAPAVAPAASSMLPATTTNESERVSKVAEPRTRQAAADPAGAPVPTPLAMPASEVGTLSQYRIAVMARVRGINRYPSVAVEQDWQGRSDVRLSIAADGGVESVDVRQSSGYGVLDREAVAMIGEAARRVPIPQALRGRDFAIEIPVIFSLQTAVR